MQFKKPPSNCDPGPWKEISQSDGIRIVETPTFESFFQFVNIGFGGSDCWHLWRGQRRSEWKIVSTLTRVDRPDSNHLEHFRDAIARCTNTEYNLSPHNPQLEEDKLKLWSMGQHHGLATPLIDWTLYPYVALFFAFAEPDDSSESRAVFAIDWDEVRTVNFHIVETFGMKLFNEKLDNPPYSDEFKQHLYDLGIRGQAEKLLAESKVPSDVREQIWRRELAHFKEHQLHIHALRTYENRRIHSQGGVQIFPPNNLSVEAWVRKNHGLREAGWDKQPLLTKIIIPNKERKEILKCLNRMNVNYLSLFPDFEGAAKHCNMALYENENFGLRHY